MKFKYKGFSRKGHLQYGEVYNILDAKTIGGVNFCQVEGFDGWHYAGNFTKENIMTELKREDLLSTKWDVRDWSEEQRTLWQQECFQLGMKWYRESVAKLEHLDTEDYAFYYIEPTAVLMQDDHGCEQEFTELGFTEKQFTDMFPNYEAPKPINVVEEIKQLFLAEMDKEDFDGDEDERGFEGLVYVEPKDYTPNIAKHNLSEDQLNFIIGKFGGLEMTSKEEDTYIYIDDGVVKTTRYPLYTTKDKIVTFNDLFKYEDGL